MAVDWRQATLTGWGRSTTVSTRVAVPGDDGEVREALEAGAPVLAYGNCRSYGDAHLPCDGRGISTARLDRVVSFDEASGEIVCESGVTFARLLREYLPRGWRVPVTPGTAFASVGGAVANDVHGKNHDRRGSFGDHVVWLDLMAASGEIVRISHAEEPELFAATIGGVGLTGVILRVAFRMDRVPSAFMRIREQRIPDLDAYLTALAEAREGAAYSVGWIDALQRGARMGRGILESADVTAEGGLAGEPERSLRVPFDFPRVALNHLTVRAFNEAYFRRVPANGRERISHAARFFYPLDALHDWNRIYGRRGFHQFQCVIPDAEAARGMQRLLETVSAAGRGSFLAVLKTLGGEGRGHLSFPMRGLTLALDFPCSEGVSELMRRLETITLDHGGRIYLAKDSSLSAAGFRRMYPKLGQFADVLERWDPQGRFRSVMASRLCIRGLNASGSPPDGPISVKVRPTNLEGLSR